MEALLTIYLPLAVLIAGITLLALGWRGVRVGDHPVCRRCNYNLLGLPAENTVCPECGANLRAARSVRRGDRVRRTRAIVAGSVAILIALSWGGLVALAAWRGIDVYDYKPVAWLLRDATSDAAIVRDRAMQELLDRDAAGQLSDAHRTRIVNRLLDLQGDASRTWHSIWGDFIDAAMAQERLTPEQKQRYLRQAFRFQVRVRPFVRRGAPLPVAVDGTARAGTGSTVSAAVTWMQAQVKDQAFRGARVTILANTRPGHDNGLTVIMRTEDFRKLTEGPHVMRVHLRVRTYDNIHPHGSSKPPVTDDTFVLDAPWTLVPPDTPTVAMVTDEERWRELKSSLSGALRGNNEQGITPVVHCNGVGIDLAFEAFLQSRSESRELEPLTIRRSLVVGSGLGTFHGLDPNSPTDLVLRPSIAEAEQTVEMSQIWGGELLFRNLTTSAPSQAPEWLQAPPPRPAK